MARVKNALWKVVDVISPAVGAGGNVFAKFIILPVYKTLITVELRLNRVLLSARGLLFLSVTNRYILHAVVLGVSIAVIGTQIETKNATALEANQDSLLYTLVTGNAENYVEENAGPETFVKDTHYLGAETLTTEYGIDFDYDLADSAELNDLSLPGTIAYMPDTEEPGAPPSRLGDREKTETYSVAQGDSVSTIADRFGLDIKTVLWANNLAMRSTLRIGQALKIPPTSGVLHVVKKNDTLAQIAKKYGSSIEQIREANKLAPDAVLALGEEIVVPGGTPPVVAAPIIARSKVRPGNSTTPITLKRIGNKAVDMYVEMTSMPDDRAKPSDIVEAKEATRLLWPTDLRQINQYFSWRHTGVDIHGRYNNAIYAADDGVVEVAGWNTGGYGLQVVVNHGNGMKTRYAHSSKIFVKPGDQVKRGEVLAMVGTTGRSTGPHLHFEVIVGGRVKNPLAYTR